VAIRGNARLLFILFFALAVVLAGGIGRVSGPVLAGEAGPLTLAVLILALAGLALSLVILARILYVMSWRSSTSPPGTR
jgi:hypothetical protein